MKHEFIKYLEMHFHVDFDVAERDKFVLDEEGNIVELEVGWVSQSPIKPDPKEINNLSVFLPLSPHLKVLHIRNCNLDADMSPIRNFKHLQDLSLCYTNRINKIIGLEDLTELQTLDLSGNRIEKIEGLENLKKLKLLDLSSNGLGHSGYIKKVEGLRSLTNLETLFLHDNEVDDIEEIKQLYNLKTLTLDTCLTEFPNLGSLKQLERLSISGEFHRIASMRELENLHTVWIESGQEIENLETVLNNQNLINIQLNSEEIRGQVSGIYTHWWDRKNSYSNNTL